MLRSKFFLCLLLLQNPDSVLTQIGIDQKLDSKINPTKRTGAAALSSGLGRSDITVVGMVAGIGFTHSLFIAQVASPPGPLLETAKLAILWLWACGHPLLLRIPGNPTSDSN